MKAIQIERHGGPEVLRLVELPVPAPGPGEVLVHLQAVGVNFVDIYNRTGLYPMRLPAVLGEEGAGTVERSGRGVEGFQPGELVAYTSIPGAYAEYTLVPAERLVKLPPGIDARRGAAAMLQGLTAHYLALDTYGIREGDTVLVHAAAGGVGGLLVQLAKRRGAWVLGTCSTAEKAGVVRESGADEVILYSQVDFEAEVKRLTRGKGVNVVYDSVGKDTFAKSLNCLAPRGFMVSFGQSSGAVAPLDPGVLRDKGSLFLTRPTLVHYIADRASLEWRAREVLGWVASGELRLRIGGTFPLAQAAEAQARLGTRETVGKLLLLP
jgi:NADPH2:quinone reductase